MAGLYVLRYWLSVWGCRISDLAAFRPV